MTASQQTAFLWSTNGELACRLKGHEGAVIRAILSPDSQRVLTVSRDRTARLWSLDGELVAVFRGHRGIVWHASFTPDSDRVLTASFDGTVRTWFVDSEEMLTVARERAAYREFSAAERERYRDLLGDR